MITINATGDTTLHTAGKYCAEDILVKAPAGSGVNLENVVVNYDIEVSPSNVLDSVIYHMALDNVIVMMADHPSDWQVTSRCEVIKNSMIIFVFTNDVGRGTGETEGSLMHEFGNDRMMVFNVGDTDSYYTFRETY